jgi:hypothetical protein
MAYPQQNAQVFLELEALIEKLGFGTLDLSFDLHNKRITATTFYGKKRNKYAKNNPKAMQDIAERLTKSITEEKTEQLTFSINIRRGFIEESLWVANMQKQYQEEKK